MYLELSPPKPLDKSKDVTVRTFHIWPGIVHENIFLALGGARGLRRHVAKAGKAEPSIVTSLTNIFTVDLRDWLAIYVPLSPPKLLDQSKNVTVRTFHIWPGSVHEHIFLVLGGAREPWHQGRHVAKHGPKDCAKRSQH